MDAGSRGILVKSASFGVVHLGIAFGVSYARTGDVTVAGAITLVEPLVDTFAHYLFDRWWGHPALVARWRALRGCAAGGGRRAAGGTAGARAAMLT
jgi:uncharacterized membrane protein